MRAPLHDAAPGDLAPRSSMTVTVLATARTAAGTVTPHGHRWRLRAVLHEDGHATEEFGCAECGDVTFR